MGSNLVMTTGTLDRQAEYPAVTISDISGVTFLGQGHPYIDVGCSRLNPEAII